jgi:GDPmannose 4,6-dehydratase
MKALVIGVTGQDGALLADALLKRGVEVEGTFRRGSSDKFWRLADLGIYNQIKLHVYNIGSQANIGELLHKISPDLIFVVAGESFTELSFDEPKHYLDINTGGAIEILEAVKNFAPGAKVFISSSSEIFGLQPPGTLELNEESRMNPSNPYGVSKLALTHFVKVYRERFELNIFTGILFPHESQYRGKEFVTRKIARGLVRSSMHNADPMVLRGTDMKRDWGAARDYVNWMIDLVNAGTPDEYVFATGLNSSVRLFLQLCSDCLDIEIIEELETTTNRTSFINARDGRVLLYSDPSLTMRNSQTYPPGTSAKLFREIGQRENTPLAIIAQEMVISEIAWLEKY